MAIMIEVTSRHMECTLLTSDYSQMPAVALQCVKFLVQILVVLLCLEDTVELGKVSLA